MKYLILIYSITSAFLSEGQGYLNDTISIGSTGTYLQTLYEVDSGYYWVGMVPHGTEPGNPEQYVLGFIDYSGNWETKILDYDTLQKQRSSFSINQLIKNNDGNFVHAYTNCGSGNCYPRIKEVSPNGLLIRDSIYSDVIDSFGLGTLDYTNIYYNETINQYTLLVNTIDTAVSNSGGSGAGNILYLKLSDDFQIIDTILFDDLVNDFSFIQAYRVLRSPEEILMIHAKKQASNDSEDKGKAMFFNVDESGNATFISSFNLGQHDLSSLSLVLSSDSSFLLSVIKGEWDTLNNEWLYTNVICKLDANYNLLWEKPLFYTSYPSPTVIINPWRVLESTDSNYITAMGAVNGGNSEEGAILMKFRNDGNLLWQRRIIKPIPSVQDSFYTSVEIRDVIENSKGGFTLIGNHVLRPLSSNFELSVYGYIVETNCLGFMGPPEAHADYEIQDNFEISFYNNSMQAGSYTWNFGDGTVLNTDEYTDTLSHTYADFGEYTVTLIARGCDEDNDTITFTVSPALHSDPTIITDGQGFFTLFPNPTDAGEQFFIYLNALDPSDGAVKLQFVTEDGRIATESQLNSAEGSYAISSNLASGLYLVNLVQGEQVLQTRRLMIR